MNFWIDFVTIWGTQNVSNTDSRFSAEFARSLIRSRASFWFDFGFVCGQFSDPFRIPFWTLFWYSRFAYSLTVLTRSAHNSVLDCISGRIWAYLLISRRMFSYFEYLGIFAHSGVSRHIWTYLLIFVISGRTFLYLCISGRIQPYLVYLDVSGRSGLYLLIWTYVSISANIWL